MTERAKDAAFPDGQGLSEDQVARYLRRHPGFLAENPEVLDFLLPPQRRHGDGVVDLQSFMIEKLRRENERLRKRHADLLAASRANMTSQMRVHSGILALLEAKSFENLIQAVTTDLAVLLDVDVVSLCVESADGPLSQTTVSGVRMLEAGEVDRLLGAGHDFVLYPKAPGGRAIYGAGAGLVLSQALLRLRANAHVPTGLLALGSRYEGRFDPGQGAEHLAFLARTLEHCIRTWLGLSAG